jgi:CRP-like cAMP-binding protein
MAPFKKIFKSGMHLFRENDRSRELYIIQSGTVKVYRTAGGKEIELAILEKGSVLGEMALIDGKPRSASAKVLRDCEVILIDADTFHNRIKGVPPWFLSIIRMTSQKIRQANRRLQSISSEHQGAHIIITLHLYFQRFDRDDTGLAIGATQHHLIQLLGVTYHNVIRTLDFLHAHNFIEIKNETILAIDRHRFGEYCEYLRLLIRKQFENLQAPSEKIQRLSEILVAKFPKIIALDGMTTHIEGDLFYHLLQTNNMNENHIGFLEELKTGNLCTATRKTGESNSRPLGDLIIKIQHSGWKKVYLFSKFKSFNPGC